jgi:HAD superfamily 5'-nucleotidase-like hydrolase
VISAISPERRVYANRTLNLRSIRAVGFDMDYTLVHYRVEAWERSAYEHARAKLAQQGWPVADLSFDPSFVILGLVVDLAQGNLVKASRFGYVTRAFHGTQAMPFERQRETYARVLVDLREPRWVFLNTLFSLSEATLFAQCVELLDAGKLEPNLGYADLYAAVRSAIDATHVEGRLKAEIVQNPEHYVELDDELPQMLLDFKNAGKALLLITNSEWAYTREMLRYALDPLLPGDMTWRELFDVSIVAARKPDFFTRRNPLFEVVDEEGLLRPARTLEPGRVYLGGDARLVERALGISADDVLFVGDHLYADVHVSKHLLRWRTCLILRELERELTALSAFGQEEAALAEMMRKKGELEHEYARARLALTRANHGSERELKARMGRLRSELVALDDQIRPLAAKATRLSNDNWGLLMRAGIDKSYFARQVERYADVYTSRVSNFLQHTPFAYLRAPRVSLPHDTGLSAAADDDSAHGAHE